MINRPLIRQLTKTALKQYQTFSSHSGDVPFQEQSVQTAHVLINEKAKWTVTWTKLRLVKGTYAYINIHLIFIKEINRNTKRMSSGSVVYMCEWVMCVLFSQVYCFSLCTYGQFELNKLEFQISTISRCICFYVPLCSPQLCVSCWLLIQRPVYSLIGRWTRITQLSDWTEAKT